MTANDIILKLHRFGHLQVPVADLASLTLGHPLVIEAARSYQQFMAADFQPLVALHHGRLPVYDGDIGPASQALFAIDRCGCPDFQPMVEEATGSNSWPAGCIADWKNNHAITISYDKSTMPAALAANNRFDQKIWPSVMAAYAEIGLLLIRKDGDPKANLQARWGNSSLLGGGSTIGLAIVPGSPPSCPMVIWCRYLNTYNPPDSEHISLHKHEIGHNLRLSHSQGGVMNPSIMHNLPLSWKGDPSHPILVRYFGGEPVPVNPIGPEMWVTQCLKSDRGREICLPLHPPRPVSTTGV